MWFLGFSTSSKRTYIIIGAITFVIILTIILRKWMVYFDQRNKRDKAPKELSIQIESNNTPQSDRDHDKIVGSRSLTSIRTYSLEELKIATADFKIRIGVGATSYVYLAVLGDGRMGAVKRVIQERGGSQKMFLDEVSVLLRISHPNMVGLLGFCLEKGEQLLLLEYIPNKSLFDRMHTPQGQSSGILTWSNRLQIALDIAYALDYLHSVADPPVIHRDIKSSNILLVNDTRAKLADLGLCKLGSDAQTARTPIAIKGSLGYVDTHYLATGVVSPKSDVYSFGVLILELVTGLRSLQGSFTLAEWTEEWRKSEDMEVVVGMVDPKVKGDVNLAQLRVMVDVANMALVGDCDARPDMVEIAYRISKCMEIEEVVNHELHV